MTCIQWDSDHNEPYIVCSSVAGLRLTPMRTVDAEDLVGGKIERSVVKAFAHPAPKSPSSGPAVQYTSDWTPSLQQIISVSANTISLVLALKSTSDMGDQSLVCDACIFGQYIS